MCLERSHVVGDIPPPESLSGLLFSLNLLGREECESRITTGYSNITLLLNL